MIIKVDSFQKTENYGSTPATVYDLRILNTAVSTSTLKKFSYTYRELYPDLLR
ncbi:hypothetical protein SUSAZ_08955 [Sulfolobus acidocaldarius SUSAZ]|nr:hypothetical protein SUSAZ_08955 [Sulfolobus acidocaldarius SUSAZ]